MLGIENLGAFILTAIVLVVTPGIDTIMVLTRSISKGKMAGLYSALGVSLGMVIHTCAATFGLSQILSQSAIAFGIIKYLGAAYLVYIGYKSFINKDTQLEIKPAEIKNTEMKNMFFTAFLSDVLNPKIALFFLAFLPQFVNSAEIKNPVPYLLLGLILFIITLLWCVFLALSGSRITMLFNKHKKAETWMNKASGIIFILLGLKVALAEK